MPSGIPPSLCVRCKGYKRLCGLPRCPIMERFQAQVAAAARIPGRSLSGLTPPGVVVGEHGYPRVRVYYAIPPTRDPGEAAYREAPAEWAARREPLGRIVELRASTPTAAVEAPVRDPWRLYELELTPAALSSRPVDSEASLSKPPIPRLRFDGVTKPVGPTAPAERVRVTGSPSLHSRLESVIWDDARAMEAVEELYDAGVDVYTIQRALSLGALGSLRRRRLVPTRWAITAVDDMLAGILRRRLRDKPWLDGVEVYTASYLGNRFTIILHPGPGAFEWVEAWHPRGLWTRTAREPTVWRVSENALGEASAVDGGFSAARTAVLEALARRGRRADVVIIREITPSYYAPVGNWHIRETVKAALTRPPARFGSLEEAVAYALSRLEVDPARVAAASPLLRGVRQARITDYMG
ncbi:Nre family DNA repair protein [Stetteria hydrogenophila]